MCYFNVVVSSEDDRRDEPTCFMAHVDEMMEETAKRVLSCLPTIPRCLLNRLILDPGGDTLSLSPVTDLLQMFTER